MSVITGEKALLIGPWQLPFWGKIHNSGFGFGAKFRYSQILTNYIV